MVRFSAGISSTRSSGTSGSIDGDAEGLALALADGLLDAETLADGELEGLLDGLVDGDARCSALPPGTYQVEVTVTANPDTIIARSQTILSNPFEVRP